MDPITLWGLKAVAAAYILVLLYSKYQESSLAAYFRTKAAEKKATEKAEFQAELKRAQKEIDDAKIDYDNAKRKLDDPS